MVEIAREAGQIALHHFHHPAGFDLKGDESPVTAADREIEAFIRTQLTSSFPGEPILGEEEGGTPSSELRWVIDPIDGTKSFLAGVPLFATLIGFETGGVPTLGVAHFPALDETYWAESGRGAFRNDSPIKVSPETQPNRAVVCMGGLATVLQNPLRDPIAELAKSVMAMRTWGDAFGHMMVACGRAQAMIDPRVSRWDVSAIIPILREAGAEVTDLAGNDPLTGKGDHGLELLSLAPAFAPVVRRVLS